jgi:hypothetical protein
MEITKCSHNSQTTFQYFNLSYCKYSYSQSASIFEAFAIKPKERLYKLPLFQ